MDASIFILLKRFTYLLLPCLKKKALYGAVVGRTNSANSLLLNAVVPLYAGAVDTVRIIAHGSLQQCRLPCLSCKNRLPSCQM